MDTPIVFERGDKIYLVGPVTPITPTAQEVEEFAFAESLKQMAPNPHLVWMRGQYVEADRPNRNGAVWESGELAIKSLTPMMMPVTVMHDPRIAVGLIADTKLYTPDADKVPRSRIDATLGLWGHRFPEVIEEAMDNYKRGTLSQSMECMKGFYDCGECGRRYVPLPGGAERENWCAHLRGETAATSGAPIRRLGAITFTGTGLIFGSRGAKPALDTASLEVFQEEVAEFHEKAHRDSGHRPRRKTRMETIEIPRTEYDALKGLETRIASLDTEVARLTPFETKLADAEKAVEKLETEKVAAEKARDETQTKLEALEETARTVTLRNERIGALGTGFLAKLGERTKARLEEQAKSMDDEAWVERLEELAELTGVKTDDGTKATEGSKGPGEFTKEEVARSGFHTDNGDGNQTVSPERRRSVVSGLLKAKS